MKRSLMTVLLISAAVAVPLALAQDGAEEPAVTQPAAPSPAEALPIPGEDAEAPAAPDPADLLARLPKAPEPWGATLAEVGGQKIRVSAIEGNPELQALRNNLFNQAIFQNLLECYARDQGIKVTDQDLAKVMSDFARAAAMYGMTLEQALEGQNMTREDLKMQVAAQKLQQQRVTPEKVEQFVKEHPSYFNGTTVTASHILIKVPATAPTKQQKAAYDKLMKIRKDIAEGRITFEEAARQTSECPSGPKGGDLGQFRFEQMVPGFAMAAFDLKKGEVSEPVRSAEHGFHLIKVTERTEGEAKPGQEAQQKAQELMMAQMTTDVLLSALGDCPIEVHEEAVKAMTRPAKE
jgi:parvulin-like peptidyl-prolyl isomerase